MDRRSWLWRRKSLEKSPGGETESSGSVSSLSEIFSDDQNISNHNIPSPEVTSKAAPDDEINESAKTLSEKLLAALVNIRAKEDLVKQHAKVAEEALSGWEKAENEVLILKKQNDVLTEKKSILEERVGQLDGALKECLRQLRQTREDQEERIHGAIEWESNKSELESQLSELHNQLRNAESDANVLADKLEGAERENSSLKLQLLSKDEELELRTRERQLCTHAAETASKHHLHSMKKVAQLEAECRRLKALIQKAANTDDHQSSSVYVESFTDSQSDHGDRVLFMENDTCRMSALESMDNASVLRNGFEQSKLERILGRSPTVTSVGIDLLDDFVEMERLAAALPEMHSGSIPVSRINGEERLLRDELDAVIKRATELEDSLKKITSEKLSLEINLDDYKIKLMESENQLQQTEVTLVDLKAQLVLADEAKRDAQQQVESWNIKLKNLTKLLDEAEGKLTEVEDKLSEVNESKCALELQVEDGNLKKLESESKIKALELELKILHSSIWTFEKEKNHSREAVVKCDILEAEISRMKSSSHLHIEELRINKDEEMAIAARNFAECQKTIASLGCQLKSLAAFEDFWIESEIPVAVI